MFATPLNGLRKYCEPLGCIVTDSGTATFQLESSKAVCVHSKAIVVVESKNLHSCALRRESFSSSACSRRSAWYCCSRGPPYTGDCPGALVPDIVGEDAVQRRDTHHAHLAFKHECCHTFTRNWNIGFHYSRIMLEHVENATQLLPLSNQCTHRSSIQSITLQRKQSTKQHLPSLLHESNTTFKQQHTHFINHSTDILECIAHHSYSLK